MTTSLEQVLSAHKNYGSLVNSLATATDDWWLCHSSSFSSTLQLHSMSLLMSINWYFLFYRYDILLHSTFFSHSLQLHHINNYSPVLIHTSYPLVLFFFLNQIKVNYSICTHDSIFSCLHTLEAIFSLPWTKIFYSLLNYFCHHRK